MKNILKVAKREYLKTLRSTTFWVVTLAFPTLMAVILGIQSFSIKQAEQKALERVNKANKILILNNSKSVHFSTLEKPFEMTKSKEEALELVKTKKAAALLIYPENIVQDKQMQIYLTDEGIASQTRFNNAAISLLKQNLLSELPSDKALLYNSEVTVKTTEFDSEGNEVKRTIESIIVPVLSIILYFMLIILGNNILLMSMAEEKENRMMETILSIIKPKELVGGKIIGLVGVVITQIAILTILGSGITAFFLSKSALPIDLSLITINPLQLILSLFYIMMGFFMMATIMVGVGSAVPTYKEATSLSSIFIILSIFPIYFATLIIQDPSGMIARILSFFPFTAPMVLLARNALGALPLWEAGLGIIVLIVYVLGGFFLAFKLFEIGSLEYNQKVSIKKLFEKKLVVPDSSS